MFVAGGNFTDGLPCIVTFCLDNLLKGQHQAKTVQNMTADVQKELMIVLLWQLKRFAF